MEEKQGRLRRMLEQLEQERDELKLKIGLAKLEARDEWRELEDKMDTVRGRLKVVGEEAREASGEVAEAAQALGAEIRAGFAKLRKLI